VSGAAPSAWIRDALQQGFADLGAGRLDAAAAQCRRVLESAPELAEGHFLVGLVALEMDDRRTALSAFGSVTRLRPEHGAAWAQLARLFMLLGQANRADRALAQSITHEQGDPVVQDLIGATCSLLGDQAAARTWYARAVAGDPRRVSFRVNLANALVFLGETEAAEAELSRVLELAPDNPQAHWLLSGVRRARDRGHVETLVRLAARPGLPPRALAFLFYALGKELEDLEEWDRAFAAFARGAAARRRTLTFDEAGEQAMYDALTRTYSADWLAAGAVPLEAAADEPVPVFVVGQPRTGTTLVERIISAHSQVRSAGELQQFGMAVRRQTDYRGNARFSAELMTRAAALDPWALGRAYLQGTAPMRGDAVWFVDKLPSNYLYVPLILKALPKRASCTGARSHGRLLRQLQAAVRGRLSAFIRPGGNGPPLRPLSPADGAVARALSGRIHDVRYEDVAADLEPHARADRLPRSALGRRLPGVPRQDSAVATASAVQVREPAHTRSVGRWRRYEVRLAPMREVLLAAGIDA
jgi:tetratricopeptide (TPR) repeat protein